MFCKKIVIKTRQVYNLELVHYFGGWVEGPSEQTDRTDGGWVPSTFGAKAEQINHIRTSLEIHYTNINII